MRSFAAAVVAVSFVLPAAMVAPAARADFVPPFKGNDTGGIISTQLVSQTDVRLLAVEHCARYGKVVKFLGQQAYYGGYISFACRWVPYPPTDAPIVTKY